MIERKKYMSLLEKWRDKKVIKVVTGVRRCGKSSLLRMFRERLSDNGVEERQILEFNFEDLSNEPFLDYHVLYSHIRKNLCGDRMNYIFFDEIQMVENFQKVVDSLFLLDNVDLYVTGSNALTGLYNTIVLKDVVARRKITDVMMLESIVRFLADNIGNLSVIKRISDAMTSQGRKVSVHTVENYISALSDSYIFYPVYRYDAKGKQLLKTGQKYYLVDTGLRNIINGTKGGDLGHILENIVFLELARRGGEIYVGKVDNAEIDFIVIKGEAREYYQVSLSVRDETTMQRELAPLQAIQDYYPKYLLTLDNDPVVLHNGIKQMYVIDWLLQN